MFCSQVLVCAPSNIAVDQLTEKIHKTGLKVLLITLSVTIIINIMSLDYSEGWSYNSICKATTAY